VNDNVKDNDNDSELMLMLKLNENDFGWESRTIRTLLPGYHKKLSEETGEGEKEELHFWLPNAH